MDKYKKYKKTNYTLLPEIPSEWKFTKLKFVSEIYTGDSLNDEYKIKFESYNEDELPYISSKDIDVDNSNIEYDNGLRIPVGFEKFKVAHRGSAILCIEGGSAGRKMGFLNQDVCFVNKLACIKAEDILTSRFIYYCLRSDVFQTQFRNALAGLIGGVSISNLKNFYLTIPPLDQINSIVNYLDHQTSIIDQLIQKKEKLIELLKEKRQAIINEAITKGFDRKSKMKDSGIDWLGEIPKDWKIIHLKRLVLDHRQGYYSSNGYDDNGYKVARITDIKDNNVLDLTDSPYYNLPESEISEFILKDGDFLFQRTGAHKKIGIYKGNEPAIYGSFLIRFRFDYTKINPDFLLMYFDSIVYQRQLNASIHGGVNPNIHAENIKECLVVVPSFSEQNELVEKYLQLKGEVITLLDKLSKQIEKLKEYRQSIISEAVTGKVDVRDWQPKKLKVA